MNFIQVQVFSRIVENFNHKNMLSKYLSCKRDIQHNLKNHSRLHLKVVNFEHIKYPYDLLIYQS